MIVAELFGYLAVFERALESWLLVRDKFLKPGGKMFPSHCRIFIGLSSEKEVWDSNEQKW